MQSSGANKIKNLLELRQAGPCGILSPEKVRILAILNLLSFRRFLGAEIWNTGPDLNRTFSKGPSRNGPEMVFVQVRQWSH